MVMTIGDDDIAVSHDNEDGNDYDDKRCSTIPIVQFFLTLFRRGGGVNGCTVGIVLHP